MASALIVAAQALSAVADSPATLILETGSIRAQLVLPNSDSRQQLLATAKKTDGISADLTRDVKWETTPAGIVTISSSGLVRPIGDGLATLRARSTDGLSADVQVRVTDSKKDPAVNFPNQIVPLFTKLGCNAGGCHGKASGQNGFRLSLLGFEPAEDYEHLTREARGRRLFPAAPAQSLLLQKGIAAVPHGGGQRLDAKSEDYRLLYRWIAQGMPYGKTNDPVIQRVEVFPRQRTLERGTAQQLIVTAIYTDGSTQDVTGSALYEANDKEMAKAEPGGLVRLMDQPGEVAVMVRYQGQVGVFRATVPLGAPVNSLPVAQNFVDELIFKKLKALGLPPSEICDDRTFLRRATLDIAGRLPSLEETESFIAEKTPDKRERLVDRLLDSPDYADYFANKWSALLRNRRNDAKYARGSFAFHDWIRQSFVQNKPYDQMVREVLTASGGVGENPPVAWYRQAREMNTQMEDTAQLFLGQKMQCAQCHHHPFEKWSQKDYYSFTAFFSRVGRGPDAIPGEEIIYHKRGKAEATNKKTKKQVDPAGLGANPVTLSQDDDPRAALVDWMTAPDNRYFSKALVNRYWKHFFGRGIVDPEDDMRDTNPPSNPELLEALAGHFKSSQYDLKNLVRTICRSTTYQLSATPNRFNVADKQSFSRFYPRRLAAEVLFDAISQTTLSATRFEGMPAEVRAVQLPDNNFNANYYFLNVFGRPEAATACECERSGDSSLAQCLHLLNSKSIQDKIGDPKGLATTLAKSGNTPDGDSAKIRELYRRALSRDPDSSEMGAARIYLEQRTARAAKPDSKEKPEEARRKAYEDMVWALLNTKEFLFNH